MDLSSYFQSLHSALEKVVEDRLVYRNLINVLVKVISLQVWLVFSNPFIAILPHLLKQPWHCILQDRMLLAYL